MAILHFVYNLYLKDALVQELDEVPKLTNGIVQENGFVHENGSSLGASSEPSEPDSNPLEPDSNPCEEPKGAEILDYHSTYAIYRVHYALVFSFKIFE